jgi:hypothetical protein
LFLKVTNVGISKKEVVNPLRDVILSAKRIPSAEGLLGRRSFSPTGLTMIKRSAQTKAVQGIAVPACDYSGS